MALLRKIEESTPGNMQAWSETFMNWESSTRYLDNYPKTKLDDGGAELLTKAATKRRTSHQSTEHELEVG